MRLALGLALKLALLTAIGLTANAMVFGENVDVVVDTELNVSQEIDGVHTYYSYVFSQNANVVTSDFNALGDQALTLSFRAPAGRRFEFNSPASGDNHNLRVFFSHGVAGQTFEGFHADNAPTVTLHGLQGDAPEAPVDSTFSLLDYQEPGDTVLANINLPVGAGETFSFSSLTIQTTVPAAFNGSDFGSSANAFVIASVEYAAPSDPGTILSLSAVPEPSSFAVLLGMGLLALSRRRNRSWFA